MTTVMTATSTTAEAITPYSDMISIGPEWALFNCS